MSQANRCNACGADLSSRASPEGYCPKCLLAFALDNGENGDSGLESDSPDAISATQTAQTPSSDSPERIGPFRILQKLGEGGMGEVYLAEQSEPVRRRVALKLIKPGMDSKQVLARFDSERQALALMDHPSIAKVFDGGTTEQGRPYFAMEYIEGEPITRYCDRRRLRTQERLELLMRVCEGVQHAHQKGVIHRDIKPSNVLVSIQDQKPVPRIIDFGVAKATQQRLTERTVFTRLGVLIGTPEYMSPEQAEMTSLDVDTRTDVYSLGVLLYELLVGTLPFDSEQLRRASFDEIRRKIREDEPSKPSTKIRTLGDADSAEAAQHRGVDPTSLRKQLRGDLDWITMKALEKDRTRRYASPSELAADIARHLHDEPVLAGPPSVRYRARKFVRRHRFGTAVAVAGVSALAIFAAVMAFQMSRVARERDRANREAEASERVSRFLAKMLNSVDAERLGSTLVDDLWEHAKGGQVTTSEQDEQIAATLAPIEHNATDIAKHLLDDEIFAPALESIEEQLADDPLIAAQLRDTLGSVYIGLGLYDKSSVVLEQALAARRRLLGDHDRRTLISMWRLAWVHTNKRNLREAEALFSERLEILRRVRENEDPATIIAIEDLANNYQLQYRYAEAEAMLREALGIRMRVFGREDPPTVRTVMLLGAMYTNQGRYDEAEPLLREAIELASPKQLRWKWPAMTSLAQVVAQNGRYEEAESLLSDALDHFRSTKGPSHPSAVKAAHWLFKLYYDSERYPEAESLAFEILKLEPANDLININVLFDLIAIYHQQGRYDDARPFVSELLSHERQLAEAPGADADAKNEYAWDVLIYEPANPKKAATALKLAREAAQMSEFRDGNILDTLALAYYRNGDPHNAIKWGGEALTLVPEGAKELRIEIEARLAKYEAAAAKAVDAPRPHRVDRSLALVPTLP